MQPCFLRNTIKMEILIFTHQTNKGLKDFVKARSLPPVGSEALSNRWWGGGPRGESVIRVSRVKFL